MDTVAGRCSETKMAFWPAGTAAGADIRRLTAPGIWPVSPTTPASARTICWCSYSPASGIPAGGRLCIVFTVTDRSTRSTSSHPSAWTAPGRCTSACSGRAGPGSCPSCPSSASLPRPPRAHPRGPSDGLRLSTLEPDGRASRVLLPGLPHPLMSPSPRAFVGRGGGENQGTSMGFFRGAMPARSAYST